MSSPLLTITGTIDVNQFWYTGSSDADTVKVFIGGTDQAFMFRERLSAAPVPTMVFYDNKVRGRYGLIAPIDDQKRVTIRLQGLDAPELHYRAFGSGIEYRQPLAESGTVALATLLRKTNLDIVPCTVRTFVSKPNEVFDCFGRCIADVIVTVGNKIVNLNQWLVRNGWAFPAYYNSMTLTEIELLTNQARAAKKKRLGVWRDGYKQFQPLNSAMLYRENITQFSVPADTGTALNPKLFRRLCEYEQKKQEEGYTASFNQFIKEKNIVVYSKRKYVRYGNNSLKRQKLDEFLDEQGNLLCEPYEIVFVEEETELEGGNVW